MLGVLFQLIIQSMERAIVLPPVSVAQPRRRSVNVENPALSQTVWVPRRSRLAARMIDLFGCSEDIEEKSLDLQRTLTLIISGQEPTAGLVEMPQGRLLIRGCITDLRDTADRFSRRLRALEAQMPYKDDWVHPAFP